MHTVPITNEERIILKNLYERRNMRYLTIDKEGNIEIFRNKPCRKEDTWEFDLQTDNEYLYLCWVSYHAMNLDYDLNIDTNKVNFEWLSWDNEPVDITKLI